MTPRYLHCLSSFAVALAGCYSPNDQPMPAEAGEESTSPESGQDTSETAAAGESSTSGGSHATTSSSASTQPSGESDSSDTDEVDTGEVDETSPTVVEVSPESGALGVADDASVVITFSEPMDRPSTQAAWQSPNIGGAVMSWNDDDTELTITPNVPLEYAVGEDVDALDPIEYSFTVDITASDKAGNSLEAAFPSSFSTFRTIVLSPSFVEQLTGLTNPGSGINELGFHVGDVQGDTQQKGAVSFVLPELPASAFSVLAATISAEQTVVNGLPYGLLPALGEIHCIDIEYDGEWDAWPAPALADLGVFSDNATLETKSLDVTAAVEEDYSAGRAMSQFRLEFPVATNGNGVVDRCTFNRGTLAMEVRYLIE